MATKLDNVNPKDKEPVDVADQVDDDVDIADLGDSPMFDDEGNLIDDGQDDEQEDAPEEVAAEEPENPGSKTAKRKITPAEVAIIELKKENKLKEKRLADLEQRLAEQSKAKDVETGIAKYIAEGNDEDTAKRLYTEDQRYQRLEARTELLDFREDNSEVFARFPQAKQNAQEIMRVVKLGVMTAEQVCIGLYGSSRPDREARAISAARGESTREVDNSGRTLSRSDRAGSTSTAGGLTPSEIRDKARLERMLRTKISDKEYREAVSNR
jgi:hypothetical protein